MAASFLLGISLLDTVPPLLACGLCDEVREAFANFQLLNTFFQINSLWSSGLSPRKELPECPRHHLHLALAPRGGRCHPRHHHGEDPGGEQVTLAWSRDLNTGLWLVYGYRLRKALSLCQITPVIQLDQQPTSFQVGTLKRFYEAFIAFYCQYLSLR